MTAGQGQPHADALVSRYILRKFREGIRWNLESRLPSFVARVSETSKHLVDCPDLRILEQDATDGMYGCDTGCEYARLEATLGCSHGMTEDYEYGDFGELADMLQEICSEQEAHERSEGER